MSDDLPSGYISLENEDGSAVAREPEPETPADPAVEPVVEATTEPETPAVEDDDEAEPADVLTDGAGRRYVPLSALQREREARKALKNQPRGLSPEEQRQLDSARYIAEQLKNRPDIIESLQTGRPLTREQQRTVDRVEAVVSPTPIAPVAEFTPDELREVAELQGYYGPDGTPDLKAAERYLGILDRRAAKLADQRVAPLLQREVNTASERQIEHIAQMANEMGVSPEEARPILRELAKANPNMMAESPEYGLAGVIFAAGMKALQQKQQPAPVVERQAAPAPRTEPLLVERSIGPAKTPALSTADRARMRQYGVDPKALEHATDLLKKADGGTIVFERD